MTQHPSTRKTITFLPHGYKPTDNEILCGRGKVYSKHPGNKTFSAAVRSSLQTYVDAPKRIDKSMVVSALSNKLREAGQRFLKYDKHRKQWFEISIDSAHEKVGHAIRDLLKAMESQDVAVRPQKKAKSHNVCSKTNKNRRRVAPKMQCTIAPTPMVAQPVGLPTPSFLQSQQLFFSKTVDLEPVGTDDILDAVLSLSSNVMNAPLIDAVHADGVLSMIPFQEVRSRSEELSKPDMSYPMHLSSSNQIDLTNFIDDFDLFGDDEGDDYGNTQGAPLGVAPEQPWMFDLFVGGRYS